MNIILTLSVNGFTYKIPATLIKSNRRSVGIIVKPGGKIIIRAPKLMPNAMVLSYVQQKESWLVKTYEKQRNIPASIPMEEKSHQTLALEKRYRDAARDYIPKRVEYYHQFTGGHFEKITIRDQKTRWGS